MKKHVDGASVDNFIPRPSTLSELIDLMEEFEMINHDEIVGGVLLDAQDHEAARRKMIFAGHESGAAGVVAFAV